MKRNLILSLWLTSILACTSDKKEIINLFSVDNLPVQHFEIRLGRDTSLLTKAGIKISISKSSFLPKKDDQQIQLTIQEALDKKDMIKGGLFTVSSQGDILESGGMFSINTLPSTPINPKVPIKVQVPTPYLNTKMALFKTATPNSLSSGWKKEHTVSSTPEMNTIQNGALLFEDHCAMCHSKNLRKPLTGPPLGNVHLFRSPEWLLKFTLNSYEVISSGDTIARCLWQQWRPTIMNEFVNKLSPTDISAIYTFIQQESQVQQIGTNEIIYTSNCELEEIPIRDPDVNIDGAVRSYLNQWGIDTLKKWELIKPVENFYYEVSINQIGWHNIDHFLRSDTITTTRVQAFQLSVDNAEKHVESYCFLFFKKRNILIQLSYYPALKSYRIASKKTSIYLPFDDEVNLICIQKGKRYWLGQKTVKVDYQNQHELKLKQVEKKQIEDLLNAVQ